MSKVRFNLPFYFLVFGFWFLLFLPGCATEYNPATQKEELVVISSQKEVQMGKSISKQVEEKLPVSEDATLRERVDGIGQKIAGVCDRKDISYHFEVLSEDKINAFSLPGGYVFIYKGLLDKLSSDDEIACVLGHEIAHIVARHQVKRYQGSIGFDMLMILIGRMSSDSRARHQANMAITELMLSYSREDELLADRLAVKYIKKAGYDPKSMLTFLNRLKELDLKEKPRPYNIFRTHPYLSDRIRVVREVVEGRISFDDYINIVDEGKIIKQY